MGAPGDSISANDAASAEKTHLGFSPVSKMNTAKVLRKS
jgi:hypothetical protein